jgi:hypothetical protein
MSELSIASHLLRRRLAKTNHPHLIITTPNKHQKTQPSPTPPNRNVSKLAIILAVINIEQRRVKIDKRSGPISQRAATAACPSAASSCYAGADGLKAKPPLAVAARALTPSTPPQPAHRSDVSQNRAKTTPTKNVAFINYFCCPV